MKSIIASFKLVTLLLACMFVASCAPEPTAQPVELPEPAPPASDASEPPEAAELKLVGIYPLPGEIFKGEAVFYFDQPLTIDPENIVDPTSLASISPETASTIDVGDNYIRVKAEVKRGEPVEVMLTESIVGANGAFLDDADRTHRWSTREFRVTQLLKSGGSDELPDLALVFNSPVDAVHVEEYVSITSEDGSEVPFQAQSGEDNRLLIRFADPPPLPIRVSVAAGLPDAEAVTTIRSGAEFRYPVTRTLEVREPQWWGSEAGKAFRLEFSHEIDAEVLREALTVTNQSTADPMAVSITTGGLSRAHRIAFLNPPKGSFIANITVEPGAEGEDGAVVSTTFNSRIVYNQQRLAVYYVNWRNNDQGDYIAQVYFNKEVDSEGIDDHFSISPAIENMEISLYDGRSVSISGDWNSDTQYTLVISEGYLDGDGVEVKQPIRFAFQTNTIPSSLAFDFDDALYFPRRGDGELTLKTRNVEKVTYQVYRLFQNNYLPAIQDLRNKDYYGLRSRWSEPIANRDVTIQGPKDRSFKSAVPLSDMLPSDERGIFLIEARANSGHTAFKLMVNTDIGILTHWENDDIVSYVHNLYDLSPAEGAEVTAYSQRNQEIGVGTVGADGKVQFINWDEGLGTPAMIVATLGNDFTYLDLQRRNDNVPNDVRAGDPYDSDRYEAFLYADRDLYRPGETAHLRWIVRKNHTDPVANVPLQLRVTQPNGAEVLNTSVTPNAIGTGGYDFETKETWPTGRYWVQLRAPGANQQAGSLSINIEEFVPNQIELAMDIPADYFVTGETYPVTLTANQLFGSPAVDRVGRVYAILSPGYFNPDGFDGFVFSHEDFSFQDRMDAGEVRTDDAGVAQFVLSHPVDARLTQPVSAQVVAEVSEEGGRPVTKTANRLLFGHETVLGLRARTTDTPGAIEVDVAAITPAGEAAGLNTVTVTLERRDWSYYVRSYYDHASPSFTPKYTKIEEVQVQVSDGRGAASFKMDQWGSYRIRVHSDETPMFATQRFYHSGYYTSLIKDDAPSLVSIKLDNEKYSVGDTARVSLEAPFEGRAIVVLQNDEIIDLQSVEFVDKKAELAIDLNEDHFPSFWIEVTAVYVPELGATQMHPFSSFGMVFVPVHNPNLEIQVAFPDLPEAVRPAQTHSVTLTATMNGAPAPNAELTLAAVDAGILNITSYQSPTPYPWLMRPRYPVLRRAHYYDRIAYDYVKTPIGGDAAALAKRIGDDMQNWIETVALWSGPVTTDEQGRAVVDLAFPEFNGQVRLMAVAANAEGALGSGDSKLFVRRPYIMRPSLPRFLDPDDNCEATLTFFNKGTGDISIAWKAVTSGSLEDNETQGTITLAVDDDQSLRVPIVSESSGDGLAVFSAEVRSESGELLETLSREMPLPVRYPAVWQQQRDLIVVPPGETRVFENTQFVVNDTFETGIVLSASPDVQLYEALDDLIRYPYGCVEQTVSQLLPLYLLRQSPMLESVAGDMVGNIDNYLTAGVDKLFAMQTPEGGFSYWRGGRDPYPYGSVYAAHFVTLLERDKLIEVPVSQSEALQEYIARIATGDEGTTGRYSPSVRATRQLQRAYALFVLALGGKIDAIQRIEGLNPPDYPRTARYLLAAALAMNNPSHPRIEAFLADVPDEMYNERELGATLNSPIRNQSLELLSKLYLDAPEEEMAVLAEDLIRWIKDHRYGSTQEKAFVISALGTYLSEISQNIDQTFAVLTGPDGDTRLEGGVIVRKSYTGQEVSFTVNNEGATPIYASYMTAGVPLDPPVDAVEEGLSISREITAKDGSVVEGPYQQGETYLVKLKLMPDSGVDNVVVADLLPAGFEVENARLSGIGVDRPSVTNAYPEHMDIRDDRVILAYRRLSASVHQYTYTVRAVTPGAFTHPPVTAECMYDPAIRACSVASEIAVEAR